MKSGTCRVDRIASVGKSEDEQEGGLRGLGHGTSAKQHVNNELQAMQGAVCALLLRSTQRATRTCVVEWLPQMAVRDTLV